MIWTYLAVKTDVFWRCSYQHPGMADPMTEDPMLQAWLGPWSNDVQWYSQRAWNARVYTTCLVRSRGGFPPRCKVTWRGLRQSLQVCGAKMLVWTASWLSHTFTTPRLHHKLHGILIYCRLGNRMHGRTAEPTIFSCVFDSCKWFALPAIVQEEGKLTTNSRWMMRLECFADKLIVRSWDSSGCSWDMSVMRCLTHLGSRSGTLTIPTSALVTPLSSNLPAEKQD